MKGNLHFKQLRLNYINNKREHLRLVISSIGVGVVAKTDDEVYVLSTIKIYNYLSTMRIYSYLSLVFSTGPQEAELLKISKVM